MEPVHFYKLKMQMFSAGLVIASPTNLVLVVTEGEEDATSA